MVKHRHSVLDNNGSRFDHWSMINCVSIGYVVVSFLNNEILFVSFFWPKNSYFLGFVFCFNLHFETILIKIGRFFFRLKTKYYNKDIVGQFLDILCRAVLVDWPVNELINNREY